MYYTYTRGGHHVFNLVRNSSQPILGTLSNLATIVACVVAIFAVFIAVYQYFTAKISGRRQILEILKAQINLSEGWAMTKKEGQRYANQPSGGDMLERANPFYIVFGIENMPALFTSNVKEISSFSPAFIEALASYNQIIQSIKDLQLARNQIAFSDIELAAKIKKAIDDKKYSDIDSLLNDKNSGFFPEENLILKQLSSMNIMLHWQLIGCAGGIGLYEAQNKLEKEIGLAEAALQRFWWL